MNLNFHIAKSIKHGNEITSLIKTAAQNISGVFPLKNIDVVVVSGKTPLGVTGNSFYEDTVMIIADQRYSWNKLKKNVQPTFLHELHHLGRIEAVGYGKTLEEAVITEGLAIAMEEEVGGDILQWKKFRNRKEYLSVYRVFQKERKNRKYDHDKWFFGKNFPKWAGYRLGYIFASLYCKKTDKKSSALFAIPAKDILNTISDDIRKMSK